MKRDIDISVFDIVGSPLCVASSDGQKVHNCLSKALSQEQGVSLSFRDVSTITSAFLNSAIGQLYGEFEENKVRNLLTVQEIEASDVLLLKRVVETAKRYFADPDRFERDVREEMGG